jgi:hypothetical protein
LPQGFEHCARKFGRFIKEEDAVMGEADFTWPGDCPASGQGNGRSAVVGGPKWGCGDQAVSR